MFRKKKTKTKNFFKEEVIDIMRLTLPDIKKSFDLLKSSELESIVYNLSDGSKVIIHASYYLDELCMDIIPNKNEIEQH